MNESFSKILQFEYRANRMMWLYYLVIGTVIITLMAVGSIHRNGDVVNVRALPMEVIAMIFMVISWVFTLYSYEESVKKQSMQMYHLIPVSRNVKFFSKQLITMVLFPVVLIVSSSIVVSVLYLIFPQTLNGDFHFKDQSSHLLLTWLFGHAICTFFAVLFKKNKIFYVIAVYFAFKIVMSIVLVTLFALTSGNFSFALARLDMNKDALYILFVILSVGISAVFYWISYRLFFRRQL